MPSGAIFSRQYWPSPYRLIVVAIVFCCTARIALALSDLSNDHIASIWLANGAVLGFLLVAPRRHWPAYLLAAAIGNMGANVEMRTDIAFYSALTLINLFEITVAAYLLRTSLRRPDLSKREALIPFLVYGVILAPLAAAILSTLTVNAFYGTAPLPTLATWFAADSLGIGIVTPVALVVLRGQLTGLFRPARSKQTLLYIGAVTAAAIGVFEQTTYPLLFLIPPAMLLVATRLGHAGVTLMVPILTLIALIASLTGHGPAALNTALSAEDRVRITQLFVFSTSLLSFWIASTESDRRRITEELQISVDKLARLAAADGLTGLSNRRNFDETLAKEWRRATRGRLPLSVVLIDVDHFKAYNDRYGHLQGDDCLKRVAAEIASSLSRPADLAVRYGGEEFLLLLPDTDAAGAAMLAEIARSRIEAMAIPHQASPTGQVVTASLGIATYDPRANTVERPEALIEQADQRLYAAKHLGRNQVAVPAPAQRPLQVAV